MARAGCATASKSTPDGGRGRAFLPVMVQEGLGRHPAPAALRVGCSEQQAAVVAHGTSGGVVTPASASVGKRFCSRTSGDTRPTTTRNATWTRSSTSSRPPRPRLLNQATGPPPRVKIRAPARWPPAGRRRSASPSWAVLRRIMLTPPTPADRVQVGTALASPAAVVLPTTTRSHRLAEAGRTQNSGCPRSGVTAPPRTPRRN